MNVSKIVIFLSASLLVACIFIEFCFKAAEEEGICKVNKRGKCENSLSILRPTNILDVLNSKLKHFIKYSKYLKFFFGAVIDILQRFQILFTWPMLLIKETNDSTDMLEPQNRYNIFIKAFQYFYILALVVIFLIVLWIYNKEKIFKQLKSLEDFSNKFDQRKYSNSGKKTFSSAPYDRNENENEDMTKILLDKIQDNFQTNKKKSTNRNDILEMIKGIKNGKIDKKSLVKMMTNISNSQKGEREEREGREGREEREEREREERESEGEDRGY